MDKQSTISRRDFLKIVAVGGIAGLTAKFSLDALGREQIVSETRLLMGTVVNLQIVGDPEKAKLAVRACLDRMEVLETVLSRFRPDSQLSVLNRTGVLPNANPAMVELVMQSLQLSWLTNGAFDITVKPVVDLYQAAPPGRLPTDEQLPEALALVGYQNLSMDGARIALARPGMQITLDGIAKGYIVDAGVAELQAHGFTNVMVEAGGDLLAAGEKAPRSPWQIGIQSPRLEKSGLLASFAVQNQAVATSGDYHQAFTPDLTLHHILDPRTGVSAPGLASATVLAASGAQADALATALMVMDLPEGLALVESLPGVEAYLVTKELEMIQVI
jgi:thiamine biosynthesis lipoprotein